MMITKLPIGNPYPSHQKAKKMKTETFKKGQKVWWWDGDNYQSGIVSDFDEDQGAYWIEGKDFFLPNQLFKTKKECAYDTFPITSQNTN